MMNFNFDARTVQPMSEYQPLPEGLYKVIIEANEMRPVKDKPNNGYMEFKLKVIEGEHLNRNLFVRLNLFNDNQMAVDIARRELSAICHVVGWYVLDTLEAFANLRNKPFIVKVVQTKNKEGTQITGNDVKAYKDVNGNDPGKQNAPAQAAPMAPAATPQQPSAWAPQQPAQQPVAPPPPQAANQWAQAAPPTQPAVKQWTPQPTAAPANPAPAAPWGSPVVPNGNAAPTAPWATK